MSFLGYYINMARSRARRAAVEAELERAGLRPRYARFEAADGNALKFPNPNLREGEMGCFTSHFQLLKKTMERAEHLHVIEDDVRFSRHTSAVLDAVIADELPRYDIILTETYVPLNVEYLKMYKQHYERNVQRDAAGTVTGVRFDVIDMNGKPFAGTTSYLANGKSLRKLHNVLAKELAAGPKLPIDLFLRNKARDNVIKVGCVFPFVTSFGLGSDNETTIDSRYEKLSVLVNHMARQSFFIEADLGRLCEEAARWLSPPDGDLHQRLLAAALGFCLTDKYQPI